MFEMLFASFAVAAISLTITKSSITALLRQYLLDQRANTLYKLFACPYCMAHYIAFLAALSLDLPVTLSSNPIVQLGATTMALVGIASLIVGLIMQYMMTHDTAIRNLREQLIQTNTELWELKNGSNFSHRSE